MTNRLTSLEILGKIGFWILVVSVVVVSIFPFYYAILTSLKTGTELFESSLWLDKLDFSNYVSMLTSGDFSKNIFNSFIVSLSVVIVSLFVSITASFALSRITFKGRALFLITILSVSMFPQVAILAGLFQLIMSLGLYNTILSLVITYMIFTLPFTIWVLTTYMKEMPIELEEAAIMDGATPIQIIVKVFLPLMWPALVTTGILAFIAAWNEFIFALTFISEGELRTIPVAIAMISGASSQEIPWGNIMAASVIVTIPLIVLVLIFQKKIVSGLTAGAVKG
ncbi:carbohydrate ABC transporter permease [Arcobacter sp.]|uniref:carbohydrate ABC transporter permease n=1 Tax=Arcobacter sp. TaxID=1872629 RepID=UPI003D0D92C0